MNEPREHDPLIDALLGEVLGGVRPPDLTQKILAEYAARKVANGRHVSDFSDIEIEPPAPLSVMPSKSARSIAKAIASAAQADDLNIEAPPVIAQARPAQFPSHDLSAQDVASTGTAKRRSSPIGWLAIAASIAVVAVAAGYFGWNPIGPHGTTVVSGDSDDQQHSPDKRASSTDELVKDGAPNNDPSVAKRNATKSNTVSDSSGNTTEMNTTESSDNHETLANNEPHEEEAVSPEVPGTNGSELAHNGNETPKRSRKQVDVAMVSFINTQLASAWKDASITPSPVATDSEWCRRVYLRLLGRVPKREELDRFVASKVRTKREDLVEVLMNGPTSRHEYAAHWASIWTNALIGRVAGMKSEEPASRAGLEEYLRTAIEEDKPYNAIVQDLLTATGSGKPTDANTAAANPETTYNGAVNFLLANHSDNGSLAAARTSRVFLGIQMQCAQCHPHPTNNLSQHQFWAFNSFFRQMELKKADGKALLVSRDFAGESGKNLDEAEVYYEQRNGVLKAAYPEFPDGTPSSHSGRLADNDRRKVLANWIVQSDRLGQAAANRLWAHFFGYGFTRPVDDIGGDNPPSHPQLLEKLGHEFASEGYSLKRLSKWIVMSDAFNRSSKILPANAVDAPEAGERPLFAHYYTRQMQAEEVYQSLLIAAKLRESSSDPLAARTQWSGQFIQDMGTDEGDEDSSFNGSMKQQLTLMNGDLMRKATHPGGGNLLDHVVASKMSFDEKVEHLFLSALSRPPNARERDAAKQLRHSNEKELAPETTALADIWWALLNSNEFILDH
jgi:hypothetical protein